MTRWAFILLAVFLLFPDLSRAEEGRLFLIQSYAPNYWTNGIRNGLQTSAAIRKMDLKEYYFDSDYWGRKGELSKNKDEKLLTFLHEIKPSDTVVIADDEAASVTLPYLKQTRRIVLVGINAKVDVKEWNAFCVSSVERAVLFEDYPYAEVLKVLRQRFPKISKINAIGANTITPNKMISGLVDYLSTQKLKISDSLTSREWSTWRTKLKSWDEPNALTWIFVPFGLRDVMNEELPPEMVKKWLLRHTRNPSAGEISLGNSLDVMVGLDPNSLGKEAGALIEKIIGGNEIKCRNATRSYRIQANARPRK